MASPASTDPPALEPVDRLIFQVRGHRVILDADLAALYGVAVKRLNQAVKRNPGRFPPDFSFELNADEHAALRSQFVTLKKGRGQHAKYPPRAFTEHGALMAASVLNSPRQAHRLRQPLGQLTLARSTGLPRYHGPMDDEERLAQVNAFIASIPPEDAEKHLALALGFEAIEQFEQAHYHLAHVFEHVDRLEPSSMVPFFLILARSLARDGERDPAARSYKQALALDPENEEARRGLQELGKSGQGS